MFEIFDLHTDTVSCAAGYSDRASTVNAQTLTQGNVSDVAFAFFCGSDAAEAANTARVYGQAKLFKQLTENGKLKGCCTRAHAALEGLDYISSLSGLEQLVAGLPPLLYAGLVWNRKNHLGGSCYDDGDLTPLGRDCVRFLLGKGIRPDLAHAGERTFYCVADMCAPLVTHTCFKQIKDVPRNITRNQLNTVIRCGGLVGVTFYTEFAGDKEDSVADNIIYALESGAGHCLALGSDFDGCSSLPPYLTGPQGYPELCERLLKRGVCEELIKDIACNNALRFFGIGDK